MKSIEIIFSQFGPKAHEVEPSLGSFRKFFPKARFKLYTDTAVDRIHGIDEVIVVVPPFAKNHSRYGWHSADYYKVQGLLDSNSDFAIATDADMLIVSDDVYSLLPLTEKFGLCVPGNPRGLVRTDALVGSDSDGMLDETKGCGFALNTSPIAYSTAHANARAVLTTFQELMRASPMRAPLVLWRAAWKAGYAPYVLPFQWCVSAEHCGIGDEIILHVGHREVAAFYDGESAVKRVKLTRFARQKRSWLRYSLSKIKSRLGGN